MKVFTVFCVSFFLMFASSLPLYSQESGGDGTAQNETGISQERLDELISTLESETARTEFIDNLKTLNEAKNQQEEEQTSLGLGLDDQASGLMQLYDEFISNTGLNEDMAGKIILTVIVLIVALVLRWIVKKLSLLLKRKLNDIRNHFGLIHGRFRLYAKALRYVGYILIAALTIYTLAMIWDLAEFGEIITEGSRAFFITCLTIFVIVMIAIIIWEVINTAIEKYMNRLEGDNAARIRTILPIARNVFMIVFFLLFALVLLSELGINVVPLLAGAGVLGIAIGFGAQTMVKDFLTGFTIILEDLIQVGDVAKVADRIGVVEKLTIRKVQLRDLAGIVYTVPFGEITVVENWTKDFSYYVFDIGIAYREDVDEVIGYLREIGDELQADDDYKDLILDPVEILGVDKFADSAVVIKARIKTLPIKQWTVGREFNRRMKKKFDDHNVEIPFPHQTLYFGVDKSGHAPAAPVEVLENAGKTDQQADKETKDKVTKKLSKPKVVKTDMGESADSEQAKAEEEKEKQNDNEDKK
jgi:small conductance mechanosensitive channel